MQRIAFVGRDFFSARNLAQEMTRLARDRKLAIDEETSTLATDAVPTLVIGDTRYQYFHLRDLDQIRGGQFDTVWLGCKPDKKQLPVLRATLVAGGTWTEGRPTLG